MSSIILTAGTINSSKYPHFTGLRHNSLSGTADYGNTSGSWNTSNTDKLGWAQGEDPAKETVRWTSWSKYEGWYNTIIGYNSGRYLTGDHVKGCSFQWLSHPNEAGGITLIRWGIGIVRADGTKKRWASSEINDWYTNNSPRTINVDFSGDLSYQLNVGWRINELHFMLHTPSDRSTPSQNCVLDINNFKFKYKCSNQAIIPAMRSYSDRSNYPIA